MFILSNSERVLLKKIHFYFNDVRVNLLNRKILKKFITGLFKSENTEFSRLNYIFCSDAFLLEINQQFLKHDYYTDTISFNLATKNEPVAGEVYISITRVKENAKTLGLPVTDEIHRVIFHGALHLCGYNDKTAKDKQIMTKAEDKYLQMFAKVPRGT